MTIKANTPWWCRVASLSCIKDTQTSLINFSINTTVAGKAQSRPLLARLRSPGALNLYIYNYCPNRAKINWTIARLSLEEARLMRAGTQCKHNHKWSAQVSKSQLVSVNSSLPSAPHLAKAKRGFVAKADRVRWTLQRILRVETIRLAMWRCEYEWH